MAYQATIYNVFIASPSDVPGERNQIRQVLAEWNAIHAESRGLILLPIGWESHSSPAMGDRPQAILNKQLLERSDLLVGVFWTRLGTPTGTHPSGTVEEIEEHLKSGKPAMLYFSNQPVRPDSVDAAQYEALRQFKASLQSRGLFEEYDDLQSFREKFFRQLQIKLNEDPYFEGVRSGPLVDTVPHEPDVRLSTQAGALLKEAAAADGTVFRLHHLNGARIGAGSRNFTEDNDRRSIAQWEAGVDELAREGLIEDRAGKRQLYFMTARGYAVADSLTATP